MTLVVPGGRGAQHEAAPVGLPLYGTVGVWCVVSPAWSSAARSFVPASLFRQSVVSAGDARSGAQATVVSLM